mgnify:FL=1
MNEQIINAIDIGTTKITTLLALSSKDKELLQIIGVNSTPSKGIKKGLIVDIDQVTQALQESVEKAERMAGHKVNQSYISVGGPHISSLNSHGIVAISNPSGEITQEDIDRVIEAARAISLSTSKQIIDVTPRDFIVDGQEGIKNPLGMRGVRLEVNCHIITASQTNLNNIDRVLSILGIKNLGTIFAGLASAEAVLNDTEKELGVVLVDIGGGKTDICIYVDGSLASSLSIPIGARHITNDIAIGLRVSLESAEKIKLFLSQFERKKTKTFKKEEVLDFSSLHLPESVEKITYKTLIDEIMNPRIEETFKLIFEEIEKCGFANNIPSGLVLTGGGALTFNMETIGKKIIGLPVRIGYPKEVSGLVDEIQSPQFSTPIGLLLLGQKDYFLQSSDKHLGLMMKDLAFNQMVGKIKKFFKQFIP